MTRRRLLLIALLVSLAAVLFGLWLLRKPSAPLRAVVTSTPSPQPPAATATPRIVSSTPSITPSGPPKRLPLAEAQAMQKEEVEREKQLWKSWLATPISFYGKVVDERGNPVPAARVNISFADRVWEGNSKLQETTDDHGFFHASGHGISVVVMASKEGYYHLKESEGIFDYNAAAGQLDTHADPSAPAIFVLKKMGKTEPLIRFEKDFRISKNGTPVEVNLATGQITGDQNQAIQVEAWTNDAGHAPNSNQPYDWRCRISVPGGGLVQRTDHFAFEAPDSGYQTADEIDMSAAGNTQWRSQVSRNYFVKLGSGNYARIDFTMTAGGEHFFTVASYLNPSGSRNVEANQPQPGAAP